MNEKPLINYERKKILTNQKSILKKMKAFLPKDLWKLWKLYLKGSGFLKIKKRLKLLRREDVAYSLIRLGEFIAFFKIEVLGYDTKILKEHLKKWRNQK